MSDDTPTEVEVLELAMRSVLESIRVSMPGRVESYDETNQSVDVQPLIKRAFTDEEGNRATETLPVIPSVPVVFPGANGFRVTFPIVAGDIVLLVFADSSLDVWLSEGSLVDPIDDRLHTLSDAQAIPGLHDFKTPLGNAPTDRMSIGHDDGPSIEIDKVNDEVRLGDNSATEYVGLKSAIDAIISVLTTWTVAPGDGGAALKVKAIADLLTPPIATGATKVKAT